MIVYSLCVYHVKKKIRVFVLRKCCITVKKKSKQKYYHQLSFEFD